MSAAADIVVERYFVAPTKCPPPAMISEIETLRERCALLENQVTQAEQALALERAAHADLQRRFEKVMDRIHVFGERI